MAILKETNMWFILIVVFAYMKPPAFSVNVQPVCAAAAAVQAQDEREVLHRWDLRLVPHCAENPGAL